MISRTTLEKEDRITDACRIVGHFWKRKWDLCPARMYNKDGDLVMQDMTCNCHEGKGKIISIWFPEDKEWFEKEGKFCSYCKKERVLHMERIHFKKCSVCGERA